MEDSLAACLKLLRHVASDEPWWQLQFGGKNKIKKSKDKWRQFFEHYLICIRAIVVKNLKLDTERSGSPSEDAGDVWQDLYGRLCDSTKLGQCVSFSTSEERFAYLLNFFDKRSAYMANMMATVEKGTPAILNLLHRHDADQAGKPIVVSSYGGGPGFSAVGFFAYCLYDVGLRDKRVVWHILDYEPAWKEQVDVVAKSLNEFRELLGEFCDLPSIEIKFSTCDVRQPVAAEDVKAASDLKFLNREVRDISALSDMFVFSFVLVENELALQENHFKFVTDLFVQGLKGRKNCALSSIFMDSTHRLWPRIINLLAKEHERLGDFYFVPKIRRQLRCPRNAMVIVYPNGDNRLKILHEELKEGSVSVREYMEKVGFSSCTTLPQKPLHANTSDKNDEAAKSLEQFQLDSEFQQAWRDKNRYSRDKVL